MFNVEMNCLIKKRPYKTDKSHVLSGKNSYFPHAYVSYTTYTNVCALIYVLYRSFCREMIDSLNHYVYTYVVYLH